MQPNFDEVPAWRRALPYLGAYALVVIVLIAVFGPGLYRRKLVACLSEGGFLCESVIAWADLDAAPAAASPFSAGAIGVGRFPQTSLRVLEDGDFSGLTCIDLRFMRNEIYARHGHIFVAPDMRAHFQAQAWYKPQIADATSLLTAVEKENIARIMQRELSGQCG